MLTEAKGNQLAAVVTDAFSQDAVQLGREALVSVAARSKAEPSQTPSPS